MSKKAVIVGILGILLSAAGIFMPVLDMGFEALNLWHPLLNEVAYGRPLTILVLVFCLLCVVALMSRKKRTATVVFLVSGLLVTLLGLVLTWRALRVEMGTYGLYVILAGGLVLLLAGIMMTLKKQVADPAAVK